jgi:hypothetical protein
MSAAVFKFYDRYILPCIPVVSIVLAYQLVGIKSKIQKSFLNAFLILNVLVIAIAILYYIFISQSAILLLGMLISLIILCTYFWGSAFRNISVNIILANSLLLIYFTAHVLLYPVLTPVSAEQLVNETKKHWRKKEDPIYVYGHVGIPANMRIQSRGELNIISMEWDYSLPNTQNHLIVFKNEERNLLNLENYSIYPSSEELPGLPSEKLPPFLKKIIVKVKNEETNYLIGKPELKTKSNN